MFASRFMPCKACGASVERRELAAHRCERDRLVDFQMFALRFEIAALEARIRDHLDSPVGRFESWVAARDVRRR